MSEEVFKQLLAFLLPSANNIIILNLLGSASKPTDSWVVPLGAVRLPWTPTRPTHNCRHTARLSFGAQRSSFPFIMCHHRPG